jgi:hypothetical protein
MAKKFSYEELRDKWYAKLEKKGFKDIEYPDGVLKRHTHVSTNKHGQFNQVWRDSKEEYYRFATHFLNDYQFTSKLEKTIWTYHTEGLGAPAIADTLNKVRKTKTDRTTVGVIIKNLANKMKEMYRIK